MHPYTTLYRVLGLSDGRFVFRQSTYLVQVSGRVDTSLCLAERSCIWTMMACGDIASLSVQRYIRVCYLQPQLIPYKYKETVENIIP